MAGLNVQEGFIAYQDSQTDVENLKRNLLLFSQIKDLEIPTWVIFMYRFLLSISRVFY